MTSVATRPDGLPYETSWQGHDYLTPSNKTLQDWASKGTSFNPENRVVSSESPDSWFQLLGLVPTLN